MPWKSVSSSGRFWDWDEDGNELEGDLVKVEDGVPTVNGLRTLFHIRRPDGETVKVWSTAALDARLPSHEGQLVRIVRGGWETTKSGRKMRAFDVDVFQEDSATP